jgi:hypothetical protein
LAGYNNTINQTSGQVMAKRSKRMRRAYMKKWSAGMVNTGMGPTPGWAGGDGLNYAKRARAVDYQREKLWRLPNEVNTPRLETLKKIEEITQKADPLHNICLEAGAKHKLFLVFSANRQYFFVRREGSTITRSICYATRALAMEVWHNSRHHNKIIWVEPLTT